MKATLTYGHVTAQVGSVFSAPRIKYYPIINNVYVNLTTTLYKYKISYVIDSVDINCISHY